MTFYLTLVASCYLVFLGTKVKRNNQVGTIKSWGPTFRFSVDLIIHSYGGYRYRSIIAFHGHNGNNFLLPGVPGIWSHPAVGLHTVGSVNRRLQRFNYKGIKLGKKFNLVIEQVWINGEVCLTWYSLHFLYVPQQKNFTSNLQPPCYFWNLVLTRTPPPVFDQK